jgi:hypothetical protein
MYIYDGEVGHMHRRSFYTKRKKDVMLEFPTMHVYCICNANKCVCFHDAIYVNKKNNPKNYVLFSVSILSFRWSRGVLLFMY